jgi:hypothetical protein
LWYGTNLNIKNFSVMYLAASIGTEMSHLQNDFNVISISEIFQINLYLYNLIISDYGGITHFAIPNDKRYNRNNSYLLNILEIIYKNLSHDNDYKKLNELIVIDSLDIKKEDTYLNTISINTLNLFQNIKKFNKKEYFSLIFLAVPFGLKILDKEKLISEITKFINLYTDDINHLLSCITIGLFVNYALNEIGINKWLDMIINDLQKIEGSEKYIDYINNYIENNFRNGVFVSKRIDHFITERNRNFIENYGSKYNKYLTVKAEEQILLVIDTLLRSNDNWEKIVLFGITNYNDNTSIGIILGILYEIIYNSVKINNNLIKRFSFNF